MLKKNLNDNILGEFFDFVIVIEGQQITYLREQCVGFSAI